MNVVRQAMSDETGQGDMAYIAIGLLTIAAIASLAFIFAMSAVSYSNCQPITTISKGEQSTTSVVPCNFDPLPVGQSAGLIFGAFAALIGSLAGYMAATRKQRSGDQIVMAQGAKTVNASGPQAPDEVAAPAGKPKIGKR